MSRNDKKRETEEIDREWMYQTAFYRDWVYKQVEDDLRKSGKPKPLPLKQLAALALIFCLFGVGFVWWSVVTNNLSIGSTTATAYHVDIGASVPTWDVSNEILSDFSALSFTYDAGADFWAYVTWTETGTPTADYTLWWSDDGGSTWTQFAAGTVSGMTITFQYTGDWSGWNRVELRSTLDTTGYLPQSAPDMILVCETRCEAI